MLKTKIGQTDQFCCLDNKNPTEIINKGPPYSLMKAIYYYGCRGTPCERCILLTPEKSGNPDFHYQVGCRWI